MRTNVDRLLTEYRDIGARASQHRDRADTLMAQAHQTEDAGEKERLQAAAAHECERAEEAEREAEQIQQGGEAEQADLGRRAWYLPGTVAEDPLLQVDEAQQGSLMGQLAQYASRSVMERDGASWQWTKEKVTGASPTQDTPQRTRDQEPER